MIILLGGSLADVEQIVRMLEQESRASEIVLVSTVPTLPHPYDVAPRLYQDDEVAVALAAALEHEMTRFRADRERDRLNEIERVDLRGLQDLYLAPRWLQQREPLPKPAAQRRPPMPSLAPRRTLARARDSKHLSRERPRS